jgi:anti-anti-sigma factor
VSKLEHQCELEIVDRGPDWLFVRLRPDYDRLDGVADRLWELLNQQFIHRLVLEMDEVEFLPSVLMGQLVMLHKRVLQHDGALRLCGLSPQCAEALHLCRLDRALPHFESRADAVHGTSMAKPR